MTLGQIRNLEETLYIWTTRPERGNLAAGYVCAFLYTAVDYYRLLLNFLHL